jgi:flagellar FliJ protein
MKKFNFRLQRVLEIKELREEQAERRLAQAQQARTLHREVLNKAESAVSSQQSEIRKTISTRFMAGDALLNHRYGIKLQRAAAEASRKLTLAEERVSDRRKELIAVSRERQSLDSLRERRLEEYILDSSRLEQNERDEEAGQRYASNLKFKEINAG